MVQRMAQNVNPKMILSGMLGGLLLCAIAFSGFAATGFSVAVGEQTINFRQTLTEDTLIPLSLPTNITSFTVTGTYQGSQSAQIHLVGPEQTWHIASYDAPQVQLNSTFVLERGGTVVQLPEDGRINYTHVFEDACDETCEGMFQGPFYLQARISGGEFTLASATYFAPQVLNRVQEPDPEEEQVIVDVPVQEPPERLNPPLECTDSCAEGMMCHLGYCISETGHLNITDDSGRLVALFDKHGRLLLAGDVYERSEETVPNNAFRIQNRWGDIAWITAQGDLHLSGRLIERANQIPLSSTDNFVIRNPDGIVLAIQGASGDLFTQSTIVTNVLQ